MRIWLRFGKQGRLKFVSHLDLQRYMQRVLNRTHLPIAFSQGFNPHPIMSFASALAMGWTSDYEILDVRMAEPVEAAFAQTAFARALPPDMPVWSAKAVEDRHAAAMAMVQMADYEIQLPSAHSHEIIQAVPEFLARDTVMAERKTKTARREINIRPLALHIGTPEEGDRLTARLMLTDEHTLKPNLLIQALAEIAGIPETVDARIHRTALLTCNDDGAPIPLMDAE